MESSERGRKLSQKIHQDLALRSQQGTWGHPVSMVLVMVTTGAGQRAPWLAWTALGLFVLLAIGRSILIARMPVIYPSHPKLWDRTHMVMVMSCALLWGSLMAIAIFRFGFHDQDTLLMLLYHAAVAFATVNLLVHDVRLLLWSLALLFGPAIVSEILCADSPWGPVCAFSFYLVYLIGQGKKLNMMYCQQISDNHELSEIAYHDYLTSLPNRLYITELLEKSVKEAQSRQSRVALLYIDLDGFKQINDRHSHRVGDLFLCEIAKRLEGCMHSKCVAARLGGDEFTILITECSSQGEAIGLAQQILQVTREPLIVEGHKLIYTASIGVSLFPEGAADADALVRTADHAMYAAKSSGKDRICLFDSKVCQKSVMPELERLDGVLQL